MFQGVRVYDPTSAQWTAPDAYAGDVHDPMSQKPFMWNNNNPLDYEDPSGYYASGPPVSPAEAAAILNNEKWEDNIMSGFFTIVSTMLGMPEARAALEVSMGSAASKDFAAAGISDMANHAATRMGQRGVTSSMIRNTITHGADYADKAKGTIIHVMEGAGPGGKTLVTVTSKDGKTLVSVIVPRNGNYVANKIADGTWVKR